MCLASLQGLLRFCAVFGAQATEPGSSQPTLSRAGAMTCAVCATRRSALAVRSLKMQMLEPSAAVRLARTGSHGLRLRTLASFSSMDQTGMKWIACVCWMIALAGSSAAQTIPTAASAASSAFFVVQAFPAGPNASDVLGLCEQLRAELRQHWGVREQSQSWEPRCRIVLHGSTESYLAAAGAQAARTKGCATIRLQDGRIAARQIDLLVEPDGTLPALPHELTHIVMADRFLGRQPPHWFDEGVAMLADARDKQLLHERDCRDALATGRSLPLSTLLQLEQFTSPDQLPAFYGQSLSLVRMLSQDRKPETLLHFAADSQEVGYVQALRRHYGIGSVHELEARWRAHAWQP